MKRIFFLISLTLILGLTHLSCKSEPSPRIFSTQPSREPSPPHLSEEERRSSSSEEIPLKQNQISVEEGFNELDVSFSHTDFEGLFERAISMESYPYKPGAVYYGDYKPLELQIERNDAGEYQGSTPVKFPDIFLPLKVGNHVEVSWKFIKPRGLSGSHWDQTSNFSEMTKEESQERHRLQLIKKTLIEKPLGFYYLFYDHERGSFKREYEIAVEATLTKGEGNDLVEKKKDFIFKILISSSY